MGITSVLKTPFRIAAKTYNIIKSEINELRSPECTRYEELKSAYKEVNLSGERNLHIQHLNKTLRSLELHEYDENQGMYSEALIIFSAISTSTTIPKNILEIGTHDGRNATILAKLFPESHITTIDLKDNDPIFLGTYNRAETFNKFIKNRNYKLQKQKNINFIQENSLYLSFSKELESQHLIWVDGAHGYPIVTTDICNCLRLLDSGGILMCDDVWKRLKNNDEMYSSIASFETLNSYEIAGIIKTTFFHKRIGKRYNGNYKYISYSKFTPDFENNIK